MNDDFIDWLVEQRIYWLVKSQNFFTEEWLISELESLIVRGQNDDPLIKNTLGSDRWPLRGRTKKTV